MSIGDLRFDGKQTRFIQKSSRKTIEGDIPYEFLSGNLRIFFFFQNVFALGKKFLWRWKKMNLLNE